MSGAVRISHWFVRAPDDMQKISTVARRDSHPLLRGTWGEAEKRAEGGLEGRAKAERKADEGRNGAANRRGNGRGTRRGNDAASHPLLQSAARVRDTVRRPPLRSL
ncbi:hypothetical protein GCM10010446_03760 [Streptomyces enissocaesilis]|uniref:Uncharacterized protein n=1 Tax=Streptomyces enissocaesilis TaxID=332589 RepID=A0ABN3WQM2_9ACTN